jgi:phosphoglycerate dehydrogenase-like enzyme
MRDINVLIRSELTRHQLKVIKALSDGLHVKVCDSKPHFSKLVKDAEVIAGWVDEKTLRDAQNLRWLHTFSTGVDSMPCRGLIDRGILVTCSKGAHAIPIAEHVLMFMLMLTKNMPFYTKCQLTKKWRWLRTSELRDKTVGIVGFGNIGREIARQSKCLGMRVIATRRTSSVEPGADILLPRRELKKLLSMSDFVIAAIPLTSETKGMFGVEEFMAMKRGAYFINIARGGLVQEKALIEAIKKGWIAGAALDVMETEPPRPDSKLYDLHNTILTPHVSGGSTQAFERGLGIFRENLRRYLAGETLLNLIDQSACY